MAYKPGDLTVELTPDPDYYDPEEDPKMSDARGPRVPWPVAYLPHSCDRWVIGGAAEVRQLIADLRVALAQMQRAGLA